MHITATTHKQVMTLFPAQVDEVLYLVRQGTNDVVAESLEWFYVWEGVNCQYCKTKPNVIKLHDCYQRIRARVAYKGLRLFYSSCIRPIPEAIQFDLWKNCRRRK